jgi:hypothetical protein
MTSDAKVLGEEGCPIEQSSQAMELVDRKELKQMREAAARYDARRKAIFLTRMRLQVSGPRQTEAEFNAEYDTASEMNIAGFVTYNRGVWVKDKAMTLTPNAVAQRAA